MGKTNWDSYWGKEKDIEHWEKPADLIVKFANNYNPENRPKVLDLGSGIGRHSIVFTKEGFEVTALDNSEEALKKLKKSIKNMGLNIKIVEGNYLEPIFKPNTFDIIISYNVIYHGFREDFRKAIELCNKYLKSNGILFFTCPTREDDKYGNGKKVAPHTYESMNSVHPGDIHYFADKDDIKDLVEGFKIVSIERDEHYWDNNGKKQYSSYWEVIVKKDQGGHDHITCD